MVMMIIIAIDSIVNHYYVDSWAVWPFLPAALGKYGLAAACCSLPSLLRRKGVLEYRLQQESTWVRAMGSSFLRKPTAANRRNHFSTKTYRKLVLVLQKSPNISGNLRESTGEGNQGILHSRANYTYIHVYTYVYIYTYIYIYMYIYIYISKFGGCKRQDSLS